MKCNINRSANLLQLGHDFRTDVNVARPMRRLAGNVAVESGLTAVALEAGVSSTIGAPQALGSRVGMVDDLPQIWGRTIEGLFVRVNELGSCRRIGRRLRAG